MGLCLILMPRTAASESRIQVREKFIPKAYIWEDIRRIAILPIATEKEVAIAPGESRRGARAVFPPDSVIQPLAMDMVKQIKHRDSTIVVMLIDSLQADTPQPLVMKIAAGATGADAIMEMKVTEVKHFKASSEAPGPYVNGARLPSIPGRPAATRVRMSFTMTDPRSSGLIWQVDLEGRQSQGGAGGSPDEADPPSPQGIIQDLVITAGSWLPF
jgi:hypothetical protein